MVAKQGLCRYYVQARLQHIIYFCRFGSSAQPIWSTYMYSTSSHRCYGTGNTCRSSTVTSCYHYEDVTVECCKIQYNNTLNSYYV